LIINVQVTTILFKIGLFGKKSGLYSLCFTVLQKRGHTNPTWLI
jgi:hypothetical protein